MSASQGRVYVISMDPTRLQRTTEELKKIGISASDITKIEGVDGSDIRDSDKVTPMCSVACTDRTIGIAQAHINTWTDFLRTDSDWALILEDDIKVTDDTTVDAINEQGALAVRNENHIVLLFCQGLCDLNETLTGSAAAYLVTRDGAREMSAKPITYHVDMMMNGSGIRKSIGPPLFDTFDVKGGFTLGGQSPSFWLNQDSIRIAGHDLKLWVLILCASSILAANGYLYWRDGVVTFSMKHSVALTLGVVIALLQGAFFELDRYRASVVTTLLYTLTATLCVALASASSTVAISIGVLVLAYAQLVFQILYAVS